MKIPRFEYHRPSSVEQFVKNMAKYGEHGALLAGGTDLLVRMKLGVATVKHIISLSEIPGMDGITMADGEIKIGSMNRLASIHQSPVIQEYFPALSVAARLVATEQIRNMATLGGNILQDTRCMYYNRTAGWRKTVEPCVKRGGPLCLAVKNSRKCFSVYQGDLAPVLIVLNAQARFATAEGYVDFPVKDLFSGDGTTPFKKTVTGILWEIVIPIPGMNEKTFSSYRKFRLRDGMDYPLAGVAMSLAKNGRTVAALNMSVTGVGPTPVVIGEAAVLSRGEMITPSLIEKISLTAHDSVHPVANLEGSPGQRKRMVKHMVAEMLKEAADR